MTPEVSTLLEAFTAGLAQVFESMVEKRPEVTCEEPGKPLPDEEMLWWEQPLQIDPAMKIWAGAPRTTWEYSGALTLKAAGLETVEPAEARNTWLEIAGQALSMLARSIGATLGRETVCEGGLERAPDPVAECFPIRIAFDEAPLDAVYIAFSSKLLETLAAPQSAAGGDAPPEDAPAQPGQKTPARSRTMELLLEVDLPVSISFGKTQLPMRDVIKLTTGSIVELNRTVHEPVDVLVNQCLVARGEVVVVEGNYGVRILEIASRQERMKTLR